MLSVGLVRAYSIIVVVLQNNYKVRAHGYKINEIVEILNLQGSEEKHTEYIIANHINKFVSYYCNSTAQTIKDLNYIDVIYDPSAKSFIKGIYNYLEKQVQIFSLVFLPAIFLSTKARLILLCRQLNLSRE